MSSAPALLSRRHFARAGATASASDGDYWIRVHRRAMACRFEITLEGEQAAWVPAAHAALDRVDALEAQLTVFRATSEVVALNCTAAAQPVRVANDLFALIERCRQLHQDTEGAFDITSTPLSRCWGFLRREGRLPGTEELASVLEVVGTGHIVTNSAERSVFFDRQQLELNFGAIGKGWALDRVAQWLEAAGVPRALLSAGGSSVRTVGPAAALLGGPCPRGWAIDVTSPRLQRPMAQVWLRSGALGTSGAGEQFFVVDGKRYGHVIDPRSGWPAEGALSVSVITRDAASADALSTAFFVGGIDLARRYCDGQASVLVLFTPDDEERRPIVIGEYRDADVEVTRC